jgi:tetratricopeptide (TPR) repeat protein
MNLLNEPIEPRGEDCLLAASDTSPTPAAEDKAGVGVRCHGGPRAGNHSAEAGGRNGVAPGHGPASAAALVNRGLTLAEQGNLDEAIDCWREALRVRPDLSAVHNNLGVALTQQGDLDEARKSLDEALRLQPDYAEAAYNLGVLFMKQGRHPEAIARFEETLRLQPDHAQAYNGLGLDLYHSGRPGEAAVMLAQAVRLVPSFVEAHNNLGLAHAATGRWDLAEASYREALRLDPRCAEAHANLGLLYTDQGRDGEGLACYQVALWLQPDSPVRWHRALSLLAMGNYERGWADYESRWKLKEMPPRPFAQPRWDGSPLNGRRILLHAEQGLGDTLQFIRYTALVKERGGTVLVECPEHLLPLLSRCSGIDGLVQQGEELPEFDVQVPLMSLPWLCGTTLATVPARVPYLIPDPEQVEHWRRRLANEPGFKIGIVWQGNPAYVNDRYRSMRLTDFEPLARVPGVQLYSLQRGAGAEQLSAAGPRCGATSLVSDLGLTGAALMETAAIMVNLDLVISPDTSAAHLAGGLGVPVWVALPARAEWRWLRDRDDSPWYPSARLFRQDHGGGWAPVLRRIEQALRGVVGWTGQIRRGAGQPFHPEGR